jgi:hypothetical protein
MKRNFNRFTLMMAALLAVFSQASFASLNAYTCTDPIYGVNGSGGYGTYYTSGNCIANHTANASGTVVAAPLILQAAASNTNNLVMTRLQNVRNPVAANSVANRYQPFGAGFSAGNNDGWNAWINGVYNDVENTFAETAFDGDITTAMLGVDYMMSDWNTLLGLALGWESTDLDTQFNNGKVDGDGWSLTGYANYMFHDNWSVSAYLGYAWLDYDLDRRDPANSALFSGSADADRWYGALDLLYHNRYGVMRLDGQMGLFYANETRDAYTETGPQSVAQPEIETKLGQFRLGGTFGYTIEDMFEPYVRAMFLWDFNQDDIPVAAIQVSPKNDETGFVFGAGLNISVVDNVSLNFDAFTELSRDDYKRWGIGGTLLIRFR